MEPEILVVKVSLKKLIKKLLAEAGMLIKFPDLTLYACMPEFSGLIHE